MEEFAIIHKTPTTQILIESDFDHDTETYKMKIRFWSNNTNAFIQVSPSWKSGDDKAVKGYFNRLKDLRYVLRHCNELLVDVGLVPEFEEGK